MSAARDPRGEPFPQQRRRGRRLVPLRARRTLDLPHGRRLGGGEVGTRPRRAAHRASQRVRRGAGQRHGRRGRDRAGQRDVRWDPVRLLHGQRAAVGRVGPPLQGQPRPPRHGRTRRRAPDEGGRLPHVPLFQLDYPGELGGNFPATYRDIVFEDVDVERAETLFEAHAPLAAPLRDVTLRHVRVGSARTPLVAKNVTGLRFDGVLVGGASIDALAAPYATPGDGRSPD